MKTSSTNLRQIERYLSHRLSPGERLVFTAKLLLDGNLRQALHLHRHTLVLTQAYARLQQKKQLNLIHRQLYREPTAGLLQAKALFEK